MKLFFCKCLSTQDTHLQIVCIGPYNVYRILQRNPHTLSCSSRRTLLRACYHKTCALRQICTHSRSRSTILHTRENALFISRKHKVPQYSHELAQWLHASISSAYLGLWNELVVLIEVMSQVRENFIQDSSQVCQCQIYITSNPSL